MQWQFAWKLGVFRYSSIFVIRRSAVHSSHEELWSLRSHCSTHRGFSSELTPCLPWTDAVRRRIPIVDPDKKPQKSLKRWYYSASRWHSGDVMVGDITFLMIFAVFDPSPLTLWINWSFYRAMPSIRGTSHGPVSVCVCLSQVGVLLKRMNETGWFLAWELHSTYPTLCCKEIHVPS